jgi:hypothetical protein
VQRQKEGVKDDAGINEEIEILRFVYHVAGPPQGIERHPRLWYWLTCQHQVLCLDPLSLEFGEVSKPAELILLLIEAANDDTHEEVEKEKGANDDEEYEVEDPVGVIPRLPNLVDLSYFHRYVHKVLPPTVVRNDEQRGKRLVHVVEAVVLVHPFLPRVNAVPFVLESEVFHHGQSLISRAVVEATFEKANTNDPENYKEQHHNHDNLENVGHGLHKGLETDPQALCSANESQNSQDSKHLDEVKVVS